MGITRYPLPLNNSNLTLPLFGGNYPIFLLDNIINDLYVYYLVILDIIFWLYYMLYEKWG